MLPVSIKPKFQSHDKAPVVGPFSSKRSSFHAIIQGTLTEVFSTRGMANVEDRQPCGMLKRSPPSLPNLSLSHGRGNSRADRACFAFSHCCHAEPSGRRVASDARFLSCTSDLSHGDVKSRGTVLPEKLRSLPQVFAIHPSREDRRRSMLARRPAGLQLSARQGSRRASWCVAVRLRGGVTIPRRRHVLV